MLAPGTCNGNGLQDPQGTSPQATCASGIAPKWWGSCFGSPTLRSHRRSLPQPVRAMSSRTTSHASTLASLEGHASIGERLDVGVVRSGRHNMRGVSGPALKRTALVDLHVPDNPRV